MRKLLVILLFPVMATAEPGPLTQYLINEPATLMDVAMVRFQTLATEFENRVGLHWTDDKGEMVFFGASVDPYYEADDDKIYVGISVMSSKPTYAQMEEGCTNAIGQLRIWVGKSLHTLFTHVGYEDPSRPKEYYRGFDDMIVFRCYFSTGTDSSAGRFWATQALGDRAMAIGN